MLTLNVLRCPPSVAPESRQARGGEISIGRGQDCDWTLPHPERHLSRRHCVVAYQAGGWRVADVSSGGTYLNREEQPIGSGAARPLRDGDRLRLGAYEIEVAIAAEQAHARAQPAANPFAENPFDDELSGRAHDPLLPSFGGTESPTPFRLPADYDPLAPDPVDQPFGGPTIPDHTPAVGDAFRPPRLVPPVLPDDWDAGFAPSSGGAGAGASLPGPAPSAPPPPVAHAVPPSPAPFSVAKETDDLMATFLRGADMPDARPTDPAATMEALGKAFRAFVAGLRGTMIARAEVKGEFRIEQTMVRVRDNNPLKFSADDDDALAALLGAGRRVGMTPVQAVTEALRDVRLHELATIAAMREAVRALVARLDPAALRSDADAAGGFALLSAQRKARAWDAYEDLYGGVTRALQDDFDGVFGKAFARAYEAALQDAARDAGGGSDRA